MNGWPRNKGNKRTIKPASFEAGFFVSVSLKSFVDESV